jgi:hypothetical protein
MRVIYMYKADFNGLLGNKWKQLLHHTLLRDTIHPVQHGTRPGHEPTTSVFVKELKNEIFDSSRKSLPHSRPQHQHLWL